MLSIIKKKKNYIFPTQRKMLRMVSSSFPSNHPFFISILGSWGVSLSQGTQLLPLTPWSNQLLDLWNTLLDGEGKQSSWRNVPHAWGEDANSTPKGPNWDSNQAVRQERKPLHHRVAFCLISSILMMRNYHFLISITLKATSSNYCDLLKQSCFMSSNILNSKDVSNCGWIMADVKFLAVDSWVWILQTKCLLWSEISLASSSDDKNK